MAITRAQGFRLGLFLTVSTTILVGTILALVGSSLLEQKDEYWLRIEGSAGGLERGAQVRYNGIRVGRVEEVGIDPDDPSFVKVKLALDPDTPITVDTVAVLNMQGITGLKYIELTGGSKDSERLEPGGEIKSGGSDFDLLTERAFAITEKIETLLDNLVTATGGEQITKLNAVLEEAEATMAALRVLIEDNQKKIDQILANAESTTAELSGLIVDARSTLVTTQSTIMRIAEWVDPRQIRALLNNLNKTLDEIKARASDQELGALLASSQQLTEETRTLVKNADVTLLRTRDDLRRALDELAMSTENLSEFTQILVDNPSALISGRNETDRALP